MQFVRSLPPTHPILHSLPEVPSALPTAKAKVVAVITAATAGAAGTAAAGTAAGAGAGATNGTAAQAARVPAHNVPSSQASLGSLSDAGVAVTVRAAARAMLLGFGTQQQQNGISEGAYR